MNRDDAALIRFSFPAHSRPTRSRRGEVGLDHLTAASAAACELFVSIAKANRPLGLETPLPRVRVRTGSVEFAVGGGLFVSGVGLIVACGAGVVAAPVIGPLGGLILAGTGIYELALGWQHKIAETDKLRLEAEELEVQLSPERQRQEHLLRELEIKKRSLELDDALLRHQAARAPASSLVPPEVVRAEAEILGVPEEYANHLLNRTLDKYLAMKELEIAISTRRDTRSTRESDEHNTGTG